MSRLSMETVEGNRTGEKCLYTYIGTDSPFDCRYYGHVQVERVIDVVKGLHKC